MKPFKNKLAVTIVVLSVAFLGIIIFVLGAGKALENFDELSKTQRGQ